MDAGAAVTPAVASLIALVIAIVLSCTSRINVGILSIAFAWLIGVYMAAMKADAVAAGFPASLFITLAGVAMLFALAEVNGTLERLAARASFRSSSSRWRSRSPPPGPAPSRRSRS
jgi:hypothetical protein